jgi:nicotinamidase-related amidase
VHRPLSIAPGKVAALFVDLQEEHRQDRRYLVEGFDEVIANVRRLQGTARDQGVPLYHCAYVVDLDSASTPRFHPVLPDGTSAFSDKRDPLTAICPEVGPLDGEQLLIKAEASAFGGVSPAEDLKARGIEWLVIAGVWTEACVHATVKDAMALGFRVLLVKDACGSGTSAMHQTAILNLAKPPLWRRRDRHRACMQAPRGRDGGSVASGRRRAPALHIRERGGALPKPLTSGMSRNGLPCRGTLPQGWSRQREVAMLADTQSF